MTATKLLRTPTEEQPFSITAEKYNTEYRNGKVPGSNFPYYEVQRVKGGAMKDHRGGEKLYHLAPLFSINVRANC